jgi:hypothetical protein
MRYVVEPRVLAARLQCSIERPCFESMLNALEERWNFWLWADPLLLIHYSLKALQRLLDRHFARQRRI